MRVFIILPVVLLNVFFYSAKGQAPAIIRGPYLQAGTENSMVVRWRTDSATIGKVNYGVDLNLQTLSVADTVATTEHELKVTGLQPATKYYYSVYAGAVLLAGPDSTYYFITNPVAGTQQPVHCWVIGDMGRANADQMAVRDMYYNTIRANRHTDVWLWTGDNVYSDGTDQEYQDKMFAIYPEIFKHTVARPAPGNHDYGAINALTHDGPYYQNFTMTKQGEAGGVASNEEGYYSFNYGNVHFVSLNSENLLWVISSSSAMANWLRADLATNTQPFVVAYWHQPPYTRGSHDSDEAFGRMYFMRTNINPILEEFGVDLVLTGHSHNYERSFLIKGHFGNADTFEPLTMVVDGTSGKLSAGEPYTKYTTGPNANQGTVYAVVGNSGSSTTGATLDHPVMYYDEQGICGFMTIDVTGLQLDARYYDQTGAMKDEFTIKKSAQNPNGNIAIANVVNNLKVYPNPFSDLLQIEFDLAVQQPLTIDMVDVNGKLVQSVLNGAAKTGSNKFTIPATGLSKGNYFIKISSKQYGETSRMVTLQ